MPGSGLNTQNTKSEGTVAVCKELIAYQAGAGPWKGHGFEDTLNRPDQTLSLAGDG